MNFFDILDTLMTIIKNIGGFFIKTDLRVWVALFSASVAFWGYTSSLRPYMHVYISLGKDVKADMMFNIVNKGKVGAKKVKIALENGGTIIPRFDRGTAEDGKPYTSNLGEDMNLRIPIFHEDEVIPPDFHYETFLGREAGDERNNKFTEPFVLVVQYRSSLPVIGFIPYVGNFKEKFYINPRLFNDSVGNTKKEVMDIDLTLGRNNKIVGTVERKYPS